MLLRVSLHGLFGVVGGAAYGYLSHSSLPLTISICALNRITNVILHQLISPPHYQITAHESLANRERYWNSQMNYYLFANPIWTLITLVVMRIFGIIGNWTFVLLGGALLFKTAWKVHSIRKNLNGETTEFA